MKHEPRFANCSMGDIISVKISIGTDFDGIHNAEVLAVNKDEGEIFVNAGGRNFWLCKNSRVILCCPGGEKMNLCGSWKFATESEKTTPASSIIY